METISFRVFRINTAELGGLTIDMQIKRTNIIFIVVHVQLWLGAVSIIVTNGRKHLELFRRQSGVPVLVSITDTEDLCGIAVRG
ncbi:Uncharacterised protein [Yersinia enterocolitica]|nr:Uncharacterised protein [Yersinia enterocolitica]